MRTVVERGGLMRILIVDDDLLIRTMLTDYLQGKGHAVWKCASGEEALALFHQNRFDLVFTDLCMPGMSGLELLECLKEEPGRDEFEVVMCTAFGDVQSAVAALRAGAYDYLQKPLQLDEVALQISRMEEHLALRRENKLLTERFSECVEAEIKEARDELSRLRTELGYGGVTEIVVASPAMKQAVEWAQRFHLDRSVPVLIEGETGTGKEILARIVHHGADCHGQPFIDVNCAALNANMFESELFGYEAGAFTGGLRTGKKGKLDLAQGGTLFLDEIGELPLELQAKLLRVLQEHEFYRVGGLKKIKCDVRLICATNRNLQEMADSGGFRRDLYYRLHVGRILIPPLRERVEDIVPLFESFLQQKAGGKYQLNDSAKQYLRGYSWPGNVRELRNVVERVTLFLPPGRIALKDLPLGVSEKGPATQCLLNPYDFVLPEDGFDLDDFMRRIIESVVKRFDGNKTAAAQYMGLTRRAIYSRLYPKRQPGSEE